MGWKGTLRSFEAAARRAERDARRQHNELLRQQIQFQKALVRETASFEVEFFNSRIELLKSMHKECGTTWDWNEIASSKPPPSPTKSQIRQTNAEAFLQNFKPSFWDKLFRRVDSKRLALENAIEQAKEADERDYSDALAKYVREYSEWQERTALAGRILTGDLQAFREVIEEIGPFKEISDIGSSLQFQFSKPSLIEITLNIKGEEVIPKETKSFLQSGKLSTKKMPIGQFYDLYQDYVCACVLRAAREAFALLPFETAIVTAVGDVVNTQTGHLEERPLLSVAILRRTLDKLQLDSIDPSDSMKNFLHRMDFKKNAGFRVVDRIEPSTLALT